MSASLRLPALRAFARAPVPSLAIPSIRFNSSAAGVGNAAPPTGLSEGEKVIWSKLSKRFAGKRLEVEDVSGGCGSFYSILISSPSFKGLSTIKQHRLVNDCLKEDIPGIHGLQLKTIVEQ